MALSNKRSIQPDEFTSFAEHFEGSNVVPLVIIFVAVENCRGAGQAPPIVESDRFRARIICVDVLTIT